MLWRGLLRFPAFILLLIPVIALAAIVTAAQVTQAVLNSPKASATLKQYATAIGNLALNVEDKSGDTTVYNGSCCYGILQMTGTNIQNTLHISPAQFQQLDLQSQVNAWSQVMSQALQSSVVQRLMNMGTFDGRQVDGNLVLACVQLGVGNCQKALNSGSCNGFADINGTTICSMADKIGGSSSSTGSGSSGNTGNGNGGSSGSGGYSGSSCLQDASSGACLSANAAMAQAFQNGAGYSMAALKHLIEVVVVTTVILIMGFNLKDVWRLYASGSIELHQFLTVAIKNALSITFVLFITAYA